MTQAAGLSWFIKRRKGAFFIGAGQQAQPLINRSLIVPAFKGLSEQQGKDERCATDRNLTRIRIPRGRALGLP